MTRIWTTAEGEMADEIAWKVYGDRADALLRLIEANPQLATLPPMLPANVRLVLPDLPDNATPPPATIRIFQ